MSGMTRALQLSALGPMVLGLTLIAQQQPPFRSGANTVAVYTTVTDTEGRLATSLTREDFEIYDDGKLQPIALFASEIQPITVVMMLDRSGSMKVNFRLVAAAAEAFVGKLLDNDKARIGTFASEIQIDPDDFTGDRLGLVRILRSDIEPAGPTPLWNAVDRGMTALRDQEGRRVVLVFSDGIDDSRKFDGTRVSLKDVTRRAEREDVMVYAIGLEGQVPWGDRRAPMSNERLGGLTGQRRVIMQRPDEGLAKIAESTGGGYFELDAAENLTRTFSRVADELHRQYALGFEPSKLDGKSHKLEVRVKKPGMKARARKSYIAPLK
jgi:Ca-activated chloride channel family protein